jgi:C1A family cysteine protease
MYTGGVLTQAACGGYASFNMDHAVQLVGYNAAATSPYWIVRNSWATNWGENGYILLQYPQNTCGFANQVTQVTISNMQ